MQRIQLAPTNWIGHFISATQHFIMPTHLLLSWLSSAGVMVHITTSSLWCLSCLIFSLNTCNMLMTVAGEHYYWGVDAGGSTLALDPWRKKSFGSVLTNGRLLCGVWKLERWLCVDSSSCFCSFSPQSKTCTWGTSTLARSLSKSCDKLATRPHVCDSWK